MTRRGFFKLLPLALAAIHFAVNAAAQKRTIYIDLRRLRRRERELREADPYYRHFAEKCDALEWTAKKMSRAQMRERGWNV